MIVPDRRPSIVNCGGEPDVGENISIQALPMLMMIKAIIIRVNIRNVCRQACILGLTSSNTQVSRAIVFKGKQRPITMEWCPSH